MANFTLLVPAAKDGNTDAQAELLTAFRPLIRSLARQSRYTYIADEVPSLCYIAILEALERFPGTDYEGFPAYIKHTLVFALNNYNRKECGYLVRTTDGEEAPELVAPTRDEATCLALNQALAQLDELSRELIVGYYVAGLTDKELAERHHCSRQYISRRRTLALVRLRREL